MVLHVVLHVVVRLFRLTVVELSVVDAVWPAVTHNELWGLISFVTFIGFQRVDQRLHLAVEIDEGRNAAWLLLSCQD